MISKLRKCQNSADRNESVAVSRQRQRLVTPRGDTHSGEGRF